MITKKKCTKCLTTKPLDYFGINKWGKWGHRSKCKICVSEQAKEYIKSSGYKLKDFNRRQTRSRKIKMRSYLKTFRETEKGELVRQNSYLRKYNINSDVYDEIMNNQQGRCAICNIHHSKLSRRLHVDHCHVTGKIRGLLCKNCNAGLGMFKEDIRNVLEAYEYLKRNSLI